MALAGLHVCETELVAARGHPVRSRPCEEYPAYRFAAVCECEVRDPGRGHLIEGWACQVCLNSPGRGCLACWCKPGRRRRRHECAVVLYSPGRPP